MRVALGLLVILTLSCVIAFQPLPTQQYTIGTPSEGHLASSFWSVESNAEGSYRWSNDQSRLRFFGYGSATSLDVALRLIGPYGSRGQRTTLQMSVGDTTLFEEESPEGWRTYHLLVPAPGQGWETPEIRLGGTLTSSIAGDGRNVGVAISAVQVRPLLHQRPLAVAEYTAFIALVLVLIWAGLSLITRSTLALGTALGMGVALLVWIRLDPAGAAYLLPPLWGAGLLPAGVGALFWLNNRIAPQLRDRPVWLGVGLIMGLAGALLLRAHIWLLFGGGLLLAGALIAASALPAQNPVATNADALYGPRRWYGFALLACTLLALGLRFFQLGDIPFGVWRDEARHGLVALHILNDPNYRPVYVPQADIPAFLFYLQTISIGLLGPTVSAVRAVPALAGSLTVLSIAYVGRQMWGRAAGAGVALMVAVSAWHIALSRLAFAAVLDPLLSLIALALLWRISGEQGSSRRRLLEGIAAGATLSLALYTYHPARLMPLAAAIWVALRLGINWQAWRKALPALIATALAAGIVAAPLLLYWLTQASDFNQRVGQVSLLDRQDEQQSLVADLNHNLINYAL
ncbi:MAG: phospholipid carrier-dependent glycosyltransferase, partial [Oscillochloris sp.]|nr:phospholipid carrier-dependent glycosyltransferase [Oscillochloris sp.]